MVATMPLFFGLVMRIIIRIIVLLLLLAAVLVAMLFSIENGQLVKLNFINLNAELPISLWLMLSLLTGFVLGLLASSGLFFKLVVERRKLQRLDNTRKKLATL